MNFNDRCYELISNIPIGRVSTYKEIAMTLNTKAYRAVGNAMSKNPNPITTPCHRIIKSDGTIGGYIFGKNKKIRLLQQEGIIIKNGKVLDYKKIFYSFK